MHIKLNYYIIIVLILIVPDIKGIMRDSNVSEMKLESTRISEEINVDGKLNESIWQTKPVLNKNFITVSPNNGDTIPFKTRIWLAHTNENLYFAFYCYDKEPDRIKSSITKRDNIWNDDWIGFNIDLTGNKRYGHVLCANPHGIQGDLYDSPERGIDEATDFVWYSAGEVTDSGYVVEFKVPLKNFMYMSGENIETNIVFERKISRLGVIASWPAVPAGQPYFAGMTKLIYDDLAYKFRAEIIPAVTYSNIRERTSPDEWTKIHNKAEFGATAKVGITSKINAEATYNPDYSHIESDEFQILVNQRYPVYYSEKRPFFMESSNIFNLAGSNLGGNSLISHVHTRKIVNPLWGAKINGEIKNIAFGGLITEDEWPGREFNYEIDGDSINPFEGLRAFHGMGRIKMGLGDENYIGALLSNRYLGSGYNQVIGTDLNYQFGKGKHWIKTNYLYSFTKKETTREYSNGPGFDFFYNYQSRPLQTWFNYEYIDEEFYMSTAFIRRVGISRGAGMIWLNHYPQNEMLSWLKKITFVLYANYLHDLQTEKNDFEWKTGLNLNTVKQGQLRIEYQFFREFWINSLYNGGFFNAYGEIQVSNWLRIYGRFKSGDKINYDTDNPFLGSGITSDLLITLQPDNKLSQTIQYQYDNLTDRSNNTVIYTDNILIFKTTYQFNKYLFLRAIIQYDSYFETILSDALISFTFIPGTVIQLGYGSQHKNQYWDNGIWSRDNSGRRYYQTDQSLFFKAGYHFHF